MADKNTPPTNPQPTGITFEKDQFERMLRAMRLDGPQMKKIIAAAKPDDEYQKAMLKALQQLAIEAQKIGQRPVVPQSKFEKSNKRLVNVLGLNPDKQPTNLGSSFRI